MPTPRRLPELLGPLAWGWGPDGIATVTTLEQTPDRAAVRLMVTDDRGEVLDVVLDDSTHTVSGTCRWDEAYILVDQVYEPCSPDYERDGPSLSGWTMDVRETGIEQALEDGYLCMGPHPLRTPAPTTVPPRPRTRGPRRPGG